MSPRGTRSQRSHDGPIPDLVRDAVGNAERLAGDSRTILDHGPFDLLVLDGGPGSGTEKDRPIRLGDDLSVLVCRRHNSG